MITIDREEYDALKEMFTGVGLEEAEKFFEEEKDDSNEMYQIRFESDIVMASINPELVKDIIHVYNPLVPALVQIMDRAEHVAHKKYEEF